jgi:uncharacterized repeat protein (TIGR03847 family)
MSAMSAARQEISLDPVSFITVGAEGPPGQRTFYLQGAKARRVVSLVIEKEQAIALAASVGRLLADALERDPSRAKSLARPDANLDLLVPVEPAFRVAELGLGVDEQQGTMVLVAREVPEDEGPGQTVRFVASFEQMTGMAKRAMEVANAGRPTCPLCGRPMDPEGHFCVRHNGHATLPE